MVIYLSVSKDKIVTYPSVSKDWSLIPPTILLWSLIIQTQALLNPPQTTPKKSSNVSHPELPKAGHLRKTMQRMERTTTHHLGTLVHSTTHSLRASRIAKGYSPEKSFLVTGRGRKLLRTRKLDADKTKTVWQTAMETVLVFMWQRNLLWKTDCWRDWHASQDCPHTHEMYGSQITVSPKTNLRKTRMSVNYSQRNAACLKTPQDNYILERLPQ